MSKSVIYEKQAIGNNLKIQNASNEPITSLQINGYTKLSKLPDGNTEVTHIESLSGDVTLSINNSDVVLPFGSNELLNGEYLYKLNNEYYIHKKYKKKDIDINELSLSNPGLYEHITPVAIPKELDDKTYDSYLKTDVLFTNGQPSDTYPIDSESMIGCITSSAIKKNYIVGFPYDTKLTDAQAQLLGAKLYYKPLGAYDVKITDQDLIQALNRVYQINLSDAEDYINTISIDNPNVTMIVNYYSVADDNSDDWVDPDLPIPIDPDNPEAKEYTHIRYSPNPSGSNMTLTQQPNSRYIGKVVTNSPVAPTSYRAYTWTPISDKQTYEMFQNDLYDYIKGTLSANLTEGDLDIIIRLMCYIFGDLTGLTYKLEEQVDPDKAEELYLRHLCKIIGYEWNEALTADQQRESIKLFIDIRRRRGTTWSLENLTRVFGQDVTSFYSSSDLRGVKVIEFNPESFKDTNYFDDSTSETGKEINKTDGTTKDKVGYLVTDYIDVSTKYASYYYENAAQGLGGAFYDSDHIFISAFDQKTTATITKDDNTIPEDTMYVRFTVKETDKEIFKVSRTLQPDENGLFPGDIMIEVPQFSTILRDALDNIRLIGTRVIFAYMIYMGPFNMYAKLDTGMEVHQYFDPAYWGYDPLIKDFGPNGEDIQIDDIADWFISHRVKSAISNYSSSIYLGHKDPYNKGFIWNKEGLSDYKGFLIDDETLNDDHTMYE